MIDAINNLFHVEIHTQYIFHVYSLDKGMNQLPFAWYVIDSSS